MWPGNIPERDLFIFGVFVVVGFLTVMGSVLAAGLWLWQHVRIV